MDTDNLSKETYEGVILEAEKLDHDLSMEFGVIASACKNEDEYLLLSEKLVLNFKDYDEDELEDIFSETIPTLERFHSTLNMILENIKNIWNIPKEKLHYENWA